MDSYSSPPTSSELVHTAQGRGITDQRLLLRLSDEMLSEEARCILQGLLGESAPRVSGCSPARDLQWLEGRLTEALDDLSPE